MSKTNTCILFALLRSAVFGKPLSREEKDLISPEQMPALYTAAQAHDVAHLAAKALKENDLAAEGDETWEKFSAGMIQAVFRYEQLNYELERVCQVLEENAVPFLPLKGSVLRRYYPEAWMRTSCDIDVLVKPEDLDRAAECLARLLQYTIGGKSPHDMSLYSAGGTHVELHFDLVEEGRAQNAIDVLKNVWEDATLQEGKQYHYQMSDAFFYFYHIAHMAKHFEVGGCGVRPFLDLMILDRLPEAGRDALLEQGGLLTFAQAVRRLSRVWFAGEEKDDLSRRLEHYILTGGVYGSSANRVAIQQVRQGGKAGYILSRVFVSKNRLQRYYPVLEKHPWLTPVMQVRRWGMLLNPRVAGMAKSEMAANSHLEGDTAQSLNRMLEEIGL